jgi:hypothetical protein
VLELEGIRQSSKITKLLQLVAFQIGKEVSYTELGTQLAMSKNTVERYLDFLEKAFVIKKLCGFSRNLRTELTKNCRYYFWDTGIRNALINNFNGLDLRNDVGELWENYVIIERMKRQEYLMEPVSHYFWRTYSKKEIDLVEERQGELVGYEIKWGKSKAKAPREWTENYPNGTWQIVNRENYLSVIT